MLKIYDMIKGIEKGIFVEKIPLDESRPSFFIGDYDPFERTSSVLTHEMSGISVSVDDITRGGLERLLKISWGSVDMESLLEEYRVSLLETPCLATKKGMIIISKKEEASGRSTFTFSSALYAVCNMPLELDLIQRIYLFEEMVISNWSVDVKEFTNFFSRLLLSNDLLKKEAYDWAKEMVTEEYIKKKFDIYKQIEFGLGGLVYTCIRR